MEAKIGTAANPGVEDAHYSGCKTDNHGRKEVESYGDAEESPQKDGRSLLRILSPDGSIEVRLGP